MKTFLFSLFCLVSALASASPLGVGDPAMAGLFQSTTTSSAFLRLQFNEASGTVAADSSGHGNYGTLINGAVFSGGAVSLDGTDDYIQTTLTNNINFADTSFTVSGWINTHTTLGGVLVAKGGATGGWFVSILSSGKLTGIAKHTIPNAASRNSAAVVNDGDWHHFAVVFTTSTTSTNGNDIQIFVDGTSSQEALTQTDTYGADAEPVQIGKRSSGSYLSGLIDDVAIFPGLSGSEIADLASEGRK